MDTRRELLLSKTLRTSIHSMNEIRELSLKITRISELLQMEFDVDVNEALTLAEEASAKNDVVNAPRNYRVLLHSMKRIAEICNEPFNSARARGAHSRLSEISLLVKETLRDLEEKGTTLEESVPETYQESSS